MKSHLILTAVTLMFLSACKSHGVDRILGSSDNNETPSQVEFLTVACCRESDGISWPASVPQSHRDFCQAIHAANFRNELYQGKVYFDMQVDCGHGRRQVGDEYYPSSGY